MITIKNLTSKPTTQNVKTQGIAKKASPTIAITLVTTPNRIFIVWLLSVEKVPTKTIFTSKDFEKI